MRLSEQFGAQARADLALARTVSVADQSGHALGEAMFLAQQCVEKQLKSVALTLHEALGLEADSSLLRGMSHAFFPALQKFHEGCVDGLGLPKRLGALAQNMGGGPSFEDHARYVRHASEFWKRYANPKKPWAMRMWKNSMGVKLPPGELDGINDFFYDDLVALSRVLGHAETTAFTTRQLSNVFSDYPDMLAAIRDKSVMQSLHAVHACDPGNSLKIGAIHTQTSRQHAMFSTALDPDVALSGRERELALKRLVVEFGIEVICLQAYTYMRMFPHNILGRYPTPLHGAQTTADVYGARVDRVLYQIHVSFQFDFDLLCEQTSALDGLWGVGHERGYW